MAHKKGVGSSKNGRESESKRLGVKRWSRLLSRKYPCSSKGPTHIQVKMLVLEKTIPYLHWLMEPLSLQRKEIIDPTFPFLLLQNNRTYLTKRFKKLSAYSKSRVFLWNRMLFL